MEHSSLHGKPLTRRSDQMSLGRIAVPNRRCPVDDKNCRGRVYRVSDLVSNTAKLKFSWSPSVKKANTPKTFSRSRSRSPLRRGRGILHLASMPTNPDCGMRREMMKPLSYDSFKFLYHSGRRFTPQADPLNKFFETVKDSWGLGRI
jgi:hypothetical protein